jgi:hypothetical protein
VLYMGIKLDLSHNGQNRLMRFRKSAEENI